VKDGRTVYRSVKVVVLEAKHKAFRTAMAWQIIHIEGTDYKNLWIASKYSQMKKTFGELKNFNSIFP